MSKLSRPLDPGDLTLPEVQHIFRYLGFGGISFRLIPISEVSPIPMRLPCPSCGALHLDEGEFATKPHHTHACQECGNVWRPAVVETVGVRFLPGFKDRAEGSIDGLSESALTDEAPQPNQDAIGPERN